MKRHYISPVHEFFTGNPIVSKGITHPVRLYLVENYGRLYLPIRQVIGKQSNWCLLTIDVPDSVNTDIMANVSGTISLSQDELLNPLSSYPPVVRSQIRNYFNATELDSSWILDSTTIEEIVQFFAHTIELAKRAEVEGALESEVMGDNLNIRTRTAGSNTVRPALIKRLIHYGIDTSDVTETTPIWQIARKLQRMEDGVTPRLNDQGMRWLWHKDD